MSRRWISFAPLLLTMSGSGTLGCGSTGQAWLHGSPTAPWQGSASSDESLAQNTHDVKQKQVPPIPDEPPPFVPRPVITLGQNDMVTDGRGRVVNDDFQQEHFSSYYSNGGHYRSYGYGYGYLGGHSGYYGRTYAPFSGSAGGRTVDRPSRSSPSMGGDWPRVPDYGPPMMDKTSPAPAWP